MGGDHQITHVVDRVIGRLRADQGRAREIGPRNQILQGQQGAWLPWPLLTMNFLKKSDISFESLDLRLHQHDALGNGRVRTGRRFIEILDVEGRYPDRSHELLPSAAERDLWRLPEALIRTIWQHESG
ncbi:hypothetical protein Aple_060990 [Acrocarpospora pleiomorpha]|uniref:Uncharacterized protein n=1 Tax=Acrocarpospora pleiomorpha TaxID=90975 RepID=A0A5M3XQT8_9ACTN|nr:hypothetical protein Aple_060990 [Acrocarpospora pleiomorpha]